MWFLYLLECQRGNRFVYYTGITTDVQRRFNEHKSGTGARFTRSNYPIQIVATCEFPDRSSASRAEATVKKLPRHKKLLYFK